MIEYVIMFDDNTHIKHSTQEASDNYLRYIRFGTLRMKPPKPVYRLRIKKKYYWT